MDQPQPLFARFSARQLAAVLGKAPSTVQHWKDTGRIPPDEQRAILDKAEAGEIVATPEDVIFPLGKPSQPTDQARAS